MLSTNSLHPDGTWNGRDAAIRPRALASPPLEEHVSSQGEHIVPLSRRSMNIIVEYLAATPLPPSAETAILRQLETGTVSEEESRIVADWLLAQPGRIQELLESPHAEIRRWTTESLIPLLSRSFGAPVPLWSAATRPQSIYSDWSDSRSIGATISIHAAAKPLMRLLYHRQAMIFIEQNSGVPLSEIVDTYWTYLTYKYVGGNTKAEIMEDLAKRVTTSGDDARVLAELSGVWSNAAAQILVDSPSAEFQAATCTLLSQLALRESDDINHLSVDAPLVNLLLESQDSQLLTRVLRMLIDMGKRSGILAYVRNFPPSAILVSFISHADSGIFWGAWKALAVCCFHCPDGIQTALAAGFIDQLMSCTTVWGTKRFLEMLYCNLGSLKCFDLIPLLLSPLRSPDFCATFMVGAGTEQERTLLYMVSSFIRSAQGAQVFAQAAIEEDIWEIVDLLVDFPNPEVRKSVCLMFGHLAQNMSSMPVISLSNSVLVFLVACLRDTDLDVIASVVAAVQSFVLGVPVEFEMCIALNLLPALLDCPCSEVRNAACQALGPQAILPADYFNTANMQEDNELIASTIHDLPSNTSPRRPLAPGPLGILSILSRSPNHRVSGWAGDLLEHLKGTPVPEENHCAQSSNLARALSGVEVTVVESATETLVSIMLWSPMGVNVEILQAVLGLIANHNNQLNNGARKFSRWMALQESALMSVSSGPICGQLVRQLGNDDTAIVATT
ncbi:armadillo-type protein [Mycena vitilis]|nr:armadillo-type protein [Mycena vitilis]